MYLVFSRPLRALPTLEHLQTNSLELAHRAQLRTRVTAPQQYSSTYEVHCCGGGRHHPYAASSRLLGTQAPCVNARHPPTGVACHQRAEYVPRLPRARTRRSRGERSHHDAATCWWSWLLDTGSKAPHLFQLDVGQLTGFHFWPLALLVEFKAYEIEPNAAFLKFQRLTHQAPS